MGRFSVLEDRQLMRVFLIKEEDGLNYVAEHAPLFQVIDKCRNKRVATQVDGVNPDLLKKVEVFPVTEKRVVELDSEHPIHNHPFTPEMTVPWMKNLWKKKNSAIGGTSIMTVAAALSELLLKYFASNAVRPRATG